MCPYIQANDGIFDVIPVVIVLLTVDSTVMTGGAPHPQWVGDNGVFQPELPPNLPPNKGNRFIPCIFKA